MHGRNAVFGWMVNSSPLSYAEMDINHDGKVEFFEMDYASSFGERSVESGAPEMMFVVTFNISFNSDAFGAR